MCLGISKNTLSEAELLTLLRQKDYKGFSYLYDHYAKAMYGVVVRIVRLENVAQEVVQDIFVKIWKNVAYYDSSKGTIFTWMVNIARHAAIDKVRSAEYKQYTATDVLENNTSKQYEQNNFAKQNVEHIGLHTVVAQLAPEYKTIIELIYLQGYTQSETAEALGIPLGTVKTRVRTALRELKRLMQ